MVSELIADMSCQPDVAFDANARTGATRRFRVEDASATNSLHRCAKDGWRRAAPAVASAFTSCRSSQRTLRRAGCCQAASGSFPTVQWLKRRRPELFREDLLALFELLRQRKIEPLVAKRFPLGEARQADEMKKPGGGLEPHRARRSCSGWNRSGSALNVRASL